MQIRLRLLSGVAVASFILAGCSTPPKPMTRDQIPRGWNPHLLYVLSTPHSRLVVEVDAVEGSEPKDGALQKLKDFLSTYCAKPDGIEVIRSDVIPKKDARGLTEKALARKYINGPTDSTNAPAAFMYVLCYDGALFKRSGKNPYTDLSLFPAIYFNTKFFPWILDRMEPDALLHEAGHMIGLARSQTYLHCTNKSCLMRSHLNVRRWFFGQQRSICSQCAAELAEFSKQSPPPNLRFDGPVAVRSETNYHVLSLPDCLVVVPGKLSADDCRNFAAEVNAAPSNNSLAIKCQAEPEVFNDLAEVNRLMKSLKADPLGYVRDYGVGVLARAGFEHFRESNQYTNAAAILQQALELDPKDEANYNSLAWLKATCPDKSVRNGSEAIAAARQACELTEWKNGQFIDTLAAAYAEAGEFQRAIEFQQQALNLGELNDSDKQRMQARLVLYQQSKPFREKPSKR